MCTDITVSPLGFLAPRNTKIPVEDRSRNAVEFCMMDEGIVKKEYG
jgi:hypothetical protein